MSDRRRLLTADGLEAAKARNLPRMTWRDLFTVQDGAEPPSAEDQAILDSYLSRFVVLPKNDQDAPVCLGCGCAFGKDALIGFLMSGAPGRTKWEWSLAHGECHCDVCGWPARAYHYDIGKTETREALINRMNITLAVHPDELHIREHSHA